MAAAQAGLIPCVRGRARSGLHAREREAGDVRVRGGQVLGAQRQVFLLLAVERIDGARVERGQPAAGEISRPPWP